MAYTFKRWDDLRFPTQGINPPGAASDPTRSTTTGVLIFSGTQDNIIAGVAQLPHSWLPGSSVYPHVHLRFHNAASGVNTRWKLEYDIADATTGFTNALGTYTDGGTITVANPNNANTQVLAGFTAITMTGFKESSVILWRVHRLASSDAADTDTGDCALLEFDIHFRTNKLGSVTDIP